MAHVTSSSLAYLTVVRDLGVFEEVVLKEFDFNRGAHLRKSWLQNRYKEFVVAQMYEASARVYILHLVACTLFAGVSGIYIDA